ncbi:uncharacterized protein PRCAT00006071001 [Priceomyces carsonii]|uniref:uncharacterized protein n=1 Tax=Priceomyces carsonii TaxID=28549 RepID=UPI002EDA947F|nr:unnamed protein product [Priceomyces carsonii]
MSTPKNALKEDASTNAMDGIHEHGGIVNNGRNGDTKKVPELTHITNNIIPLSLVLKFYTQEAYKQLLTMIESLANESETEPDVKRKKKFLQLIISLRQDFVKLYTLVKWASKSKDVSKLIDILNWLRTQEFYFDNLGLGLNELNRFSGAKLPNADIVTSLEVFLKGRPQLPSYNLIETPKISSEKILEVLRDLNLVLQTRMALIENIPKRLLQNYTIKDGRIYFTIPDEFQVSVTIANDLIVESDDDYNKSPFFFIDFKFLFGINPDNFLITYRNNKVITELPSSSHQHLEKVINNTLLHEGLRGLYDVCHKYCISFKLYLITRQLRDLSLNTKWRNNIQFKYQNAKSLIIINYWSSHYLSRNWKSFIEIGIDKTYNLNFRWFKNGRYVLDHGISGIFDKGSSHFENNNDEQNDELQDLSIDLLISIIANKHAESLISQIHSAFNKALSSDNEHASHIGPHQLQLKLAPNKSAIFAINPLTGFFYFTEPNAAQNQLCKKNNNPPHNVSSSSFYKEEDMIKSIVNNLVSLRLDTVNKIINYRLITTGWIANDVIKILEHDASQILGNNESPQDFGKVQFYRRKNWPSSWFLIYVINGKTSAACWWVARIRSIKAEWKLQWTSKLSDQESELGYVFFHKLSDLCSSKIIDHMLLEELETKHIKFLIKDHAPDFMRKYNIEPSNEDEKSMIYDSMIVLFNDGNLLPIYNSSTSLFLKIVVLRSNNSTLMNLKLMGTLRNLPIKTFQKCFIKLGLTIGDDQSSFNINDLIDLTDTINENSSGVMLLDSIFSSLTRLKELIRIVDQLYKNDIKIVENTMDSIVLQIDDEMPNLEIKLPEDSNESIRLLKNVKSDGLQYEISLLLEFLNLYLNEKITDYSIIGIIKYLKEVVPVIKAIKSTKQAISKNSARLSNGLPKLIFEMKITNLNLIQVIYYLNYTNANAPKKMTKSKIVVSLSFRLNKFSVKKQSLLKLSLKDNLNSKNLKHKQLFEQIFKAINEYEQSTKNSLLVKVMRLNYDFLVDFRSVKVLMLRITDCCILYSQGL